MLGSYCNCSYDTVKYVHIRDSRLGLSKALLLILILLYVLVFEVFASGGWLESKPIRGVTRFSLQQPTVDNCDPSNNNNNDDKNNCSNAFVPVQTLPYCSQRYSDNNSDKENKKNASDLYKGNVYPCEYYEAVNMQLVSESSLAVITRGSAVNQTLVCPTPVAAASESTASAAACPRTYADTSPGFKFYTAQAEAFTILLDHAVTQDKICHDRMSSAGTAAAGAASGEGNDNENYYYACSAESKRYKGRLYIPQNHELCRSQNHQHGTNNSYTSIRGSEHANQAPCYIQPNQTIDGHDFFSLHVLLQAAGVDLDDCNDNDDSDSGGAAGSSSEGQRCKTNRETGLTVLLAIVWNDFERWNGVVEPFYYYKAQVVAGSSFKQQIPFYQHYRQSRTLLNAHGVKVAVLLGGEFHAFDIVTFLVTLTTGLGLLAVATTIVDALMMYILPEKDRYVQVKYEQTDDFGVPQQQQQDEQQLEQQQGNFGFAGLSSQQRAASAEADGRDCNTTTGRPPIEGSSEEQASLNEPLLQLEESLQRDRLS